MWSLQRCIHDFFSAVRAAYRHSGTPGQNPCISRVVEAICIRLCREHPEGRTVCGRKYNRWTAILTDYSLIRENIITSNVIMSKTRLQLFTINLRTLTQW